MSYFNKAAKVTEYLRKKKHRLAPLMKYIMENARVFQYDAAGQEIAKLVPKLKTADDVPEKFHLPFPITALEDREGCTIAIDIRHDNKAPRGWLNAAQVIENFAEDVVVGRNQPRLLIDIKTGNSFEEYKISGLPKNSVSIIIGLANPTAASLSDKFITRAFAALYVDPGRDEVLDLFRMYRIDPDTHHSKLAKTTADYYSKGTQVTDKMTDSERIYMTVVYDLMNSVKVAIPEVMVLNHAERFVVEVHPKGYDPSKKNKRILLTHERPVYTVLRPLEARRYMGLPDPEEVKEAEEGSREKRKIWERRAHLRRAHTRRHPQDPEKVVKVKESFVRAVWHGPSENEHKGRIYKVLLGREGAIVS